jgi:hypothetical protein
MKKPEKTDIGPPEVPDDKPGDPAKHRRQAFWTLLVCVILIIVTLALIVNELIQGP